jgi:calcium-translocating P-type ATPase
MRAQAKDRAGEQEQDRRHWHAIEQAEVEPALNTSDHGLSDEEAKQRIARYGPNRLQEVKPPSVVALLLHQFTSPLIYILLIAAVVTLILQEYVDSAVIAAVLIINATIGFTQERKAEQAIRALMQLVSPKAHIVRDGREWEVDSRDLVPGDLVLLESGARVPADLRLISATALMIDESLLTGESSPVGKQTRPLDEKTQVADRTNMAYMGTIVTSGRGRGYVVGTAAATEIGSIAESIRSEERAETPMQQRMGRFARIVAVAVLISVVIAFIIGVVLGEPPGDMFMVAVALAVAAIPEGLPVVFTITLALGVRRMARSNAVIRRLPAVETLGSTTVIGSDKTGTLTENRMTVQSVWTGRQAYDVSPDGFRQGSDGEQEVHPEEGSPLYLTLLAGVLTNEAEVYRTDGGEFESRGDPTEAALLVAAARAGVEPEDVRARYDVYAEIPFESERQYSASVRIRDGKHQAFVKGAPERVLQMCSEMLTDDGPAPLDADAIHDAARELASRGLRVLAMAMHGRFDHAVEKGGDVPEPGELTFLGLQGMMDPPREGVKEAVAGCKDAGIRVIMITGDHAGTARAIARDLGIAGDDADVLPGGEVEEMTDEDLREKVRDVAVYARVSPEHKLRVVRALQAHGDTVAVTGDGVALKSADIGVAMGKSGTDVAREASDMVLTDDNFVSIYAAVEEGRITFDNVRKVTFFLISTGVASIVALLAALAMQWPLLMVPAQLLWLNLVTKGLQDVSLAFEPGEKGVLKRPPRAREEGVVSPLLWERTAVTAIVMAIGTLALFRWELDRTGSEDLARTVALTTMVVMSAMHVGNSRSEYLSIFEKNPFSNPFLFIATGAALALHIGALYLPPTQFVLRVEPIGIETWTRIVLVSLSILAAIELHKLFRRGKRPEAEPATAPG